MKLQACTASFDRDIPSQLLLCASAEDVADAYVVLAQRLHDGTWLPFAHQFVECLGSLCARGERLAQLTDLGSNAFGQLPQLSFEHQAWSVVPAAIADPSLSARWASSISQAVLESLDKMGAGQAKLVCHIAERLTARIPLGEADAALTPVLPAVLTWLLQKGHAELRSPEHAALVAHALETAASSSSDVIGKDRMVLLARFSLHHPSAFARISQGPAFGMVILSLQNAGEHVIATEFLQTATERDLLAQAIASCDADLRPQIECLWRDGVASGAVPLPDDLVATFMKALPQASPAPTVSARLMRELIAGAAPFSLRDEWVVYLTSAAPNSMSMNASGMNLEWAWLQSQVLQLLSSAQESHRIFQELTKGSTPKTDALKAAMAAMRAKSVGLTSQSLKALVDLWLTEMRQRIQDPAGTSEQHGVFRQAIDRIISFAWSTPIFGVPVADMFGPLVKCELLPLDKGDLVRVDLHRQVVQLDSDYADEVARDKSLDGQEQIALICLYFLHEYIHHFQHVATKEQVARLRVTGAEATLMHIDLCADHASTVIANAVFPMWTVPFLKQLQARTLTAFPTSSLYPEAARWRKAIRRASIMADASYMASAGRESGSYRYVEFGATGGRFALLDNGPPLRVVGDCEIAAAEIAQLESCADPGAAAPQQVAGFAELVASLVKRCMGK